MAERGAIRSGIGGWNFEPWRGVFYPEKLRQADELHFASRALATIEINSTYYSSQAPETFAGWAAETPEDFIFSVKASRFATNRKLLADAGESVERFLNQGVIELGDRLGPIVWQMALTKKFEPGDFAAFLDLLPPTLQGRPLRHVVEIRHESFRDPAFVALCKARNIAICLSEDARYECVPDVTADFVYARLMKGDDRLKTAYPAKDMKRWAERFVELAEGGRPDDLPYVTADAPARQPRDAFVYFIHEAKVRAPAAAQAFQKSVRKL